VHAETYWNHNTAFHGELVADAARRGGRALDVGCGEGLLAVRLARVCDEVLGIDTDAAALGAARLRLEGGGTARVQQTDVLGPEVEALGVFDTVTCVAVLHHLPLERGLERLAALVAPGGRLLVIGLAANRGATDWLLSGLSLVPVRVASFLHHETRDVGVRTAAPQQSLREIRSVAARVLPGCRVRRRFYYRYSLVWDRPTGRA